MGGVTRNQNVQKYVNNPLGMSSFTEGLPMEGDELEEYALRSNARRQQEEYDLQREDDLNRARASKVKISRNGSAFQFFNNGVLYV